MSHLPPIASTPAHLEDPVMSGVTSLAKSPIPIASPSKPLTREPSLVALSFAFDAVAKTLNVVIRDKRSGEVVRTIEYTRIPADVHQNDKLNGLLLNQFA
jgi:hypothetical protein